MNVLPPDDKALLEGLTNQVMTIFFLFSFLFFNVFLSSFFCIYFFFLRRGLFGQNEVT